MFWGIILKPNTKYMTTVEKAFRISQACLEFKKPEDKICLKVLYKELEMILCYLSAQQTPQCALDLEFTKKERLTLFAEGSGTVHLTGTMEEENVEDSEDNFDAKAMLARGGHKRKGELMSPNAALAGAKRPRKSGTSEDDEDDTDFDSDAELDSDLLEEEEDEDEDLEGGSDLESFDEDAELDEDDDDDDDDDDEDEEDEDEDDEEEATPAKKPVVKEVKEERKSAPQPKSDKKKGQQKQQEARKSEPTAASDANKQNGQSPAKGEAQESGKKKKRNKKKKGGEGDAVTPAKSPAAKGAPASAEKSSKVVNKNGVQIEVLKQGTGPVAKSGKSVHMYYRGRLKANNKEFDHCTEGKGFRFRLGGGEVIKGWDIGVEGMKVGEKRRLVIPPKLGYGEKGVKPSIPPNAALVFDVELKAVS